MFCARRARRARRRNRPRYLREERALNRHSRFERGFVFGAALAALLVGETARAEGGERAETSNGVNPSPERLLSGFAALDRPHGIIEGNVCVLTLPAAEVCVERSTGCKEGDLSFAL